MTWKLLAAGAKVDAIELQHASAHELEARISRINPEFFDNEPLSERLDVQAGDALEILADAKYLEKYDYIWCSQVIHFMSPEQIDLLKLRLNEILKPGGKVFMMSNYLKQLDSSDPGHYVQIANDAAFEAGKSCPGYMSVNMATLIDPMVGRIVDARVLSAYNYDQMKVNGMPLEVNAYVKGEFTGPKQDYDLSLVFAGSMGGLTLPGLGHFNKLYQTMNLFDPKTSELTFQQAGFDVVAFKLDYQTDRKPLDEEKTMGIANIILMEKGAAERPESITESGLARLHQFFEPSPLAKVDFTLGRLVGTDTKKGSLGEAYQKQDFSLLLRRASAQANLAVVKLLLDNKKLLGVDVEQKSSNGKSALDWNRASKKVDERIQQAIESLLIKHHPVRGLEAELFTSPAI